MPTDDFNQRVAAKESELHALIADLEAVRREVLPVAAKLAMRWWESRIGIEVERNATVTAGLTDDQLGKLKAQVQELGSSAKEHVASFLADGKAWWHLQTPITAPINDYSYNYDPDARRRRGPERIEKQLGLALGKLGSILEPFGYLAGTGRWPKDSGGRFYANPKWVDWPEELNPLMYRYSARVSKAQILIAELARLRLGRRPMAEGDSWRTYAAKARYWFAAYNNAVELEREHAVGLSRFRLRPPDPGALHGTDWLNERARANVNHMREYDPEDIPMGDF
jgi:hypothetical protein